VCVSDTSGHLNVSTGGHVETAYRVWYGYAWTSTTGAGSTITPSDFSSVTSATHLCVSGSIAPTPDSSGSATLGVNINQQSATNLGGWSTSAPTEGVLVSVYNPGGSPLRVELREASAFTSTPQRWCALFDPTYAVVIPFSAFNTQCDGSGSSYGSARIEAVAIVAAGNSAGAVSFDFCLQDLGVVFS
jgi:hypothetical protein